MNLSLPLNLQALLCFSDLEQYENGLIITKCHILIVNKNSAIKSHAKSVVVRKR